MKTERINVRVTPEFKNEIARKAGASGLTLSDFLLYSAKIADAAKIAQVRDQDELAGLAA